LALNATTGVLSGTPTSATPRTFTIRVTDSQGTPATATKQFTVTPSIAPLTITTATPMANLTFGTFSATNMAATGGVAPYTWSATGTLPPGMSVTAAGSFRGTPTAHGTFTFTLRVADSQGTPAVTTKAMTVTVP
jgi:hypothetical protein